LALDNPAIRPRRGNRLLEGRNEIPLFYHVSTRAHVFLMSSEDTQQRPCRTIFRSRYGPIVPPEHVFNADDCWRELNQVCKKYQFSEVLTATEILRIISCSSFHMNARTTLRNKDRIKNKQKTLWRKERFLWNSLFRVRILLGASCLAHMIGIMDMMGEMI